MGDFFQEIYRRLELHEGFVPTRYKCTAGVTTQGIGHNLDANPLTEEQRERIADLDNWTHEEAVSILADDVKLCIDDLQRNFDWVQGLDRERIYAMIDLDFNLGINRLKGFKKFLKALAEKRYSLATLELMDSKWYKQVGKRGARIARLVGTGQWEE